MRKFRILICLFINVLILNGCTTLLVGGAGAGGYAIAKDQRKVGVIASDVNQIDAFDINVDTYRGVVTLHGHTKNVAQTTRAIRLARTINGVKKVISKLVVIK